MKKTEHEWQQELSEEAFLVCRKKATEPPFSGKLLYCDKTGVYRCTCCKADLFSSDDKFDSGCGWPSFSKGINEQAIAYTEDLSHGMIRTEITCSNCGSHLGHVFNDGPQPTGQRYCVNSVALHFDDTRAC